MFLWVFWRFDFDDDEVTIFVIIVLISGLIPEGWCGGEKREVSAFFICRAFFLRLFDDFALRILVICQVYQNDVLF